MKNKANFAQKQNRSSWILLAPAMVLILIFSIYPALKALMTSFQTGAGLNMQFAGLSNYTRILKDKVFIQSLINCIVYLIIQVPIMLVLALVLASALNDRALKCRGLFRTAIFLPCATSLVSYAIIFRSLFATDGFINSILVKIGVLDQAFNFLSNATAAKAIIILALIWRWTGYNMVFYLAGLQNIDYSVYEAAKIDGATPFQTFTRITVPLLKPTILMTAIMSTNGTLQLFDESVNLTFGGPGTSTMTMSHYIYNQAFMGVPNFGYTSAMAFVILIMVAILAFVQLKVGEKDE
ncbi:MAG: sugar ABC transporter permease [Lachnospiraceae bacterium]|uniref:carbohydrate ABC transporter permease n=1 Tax=Agathobacter sp. TaxID=2021311 RepID=UPI003B0A49BF|nr:sugar ABC transporter permease [Lachnospiraceae bacterium]